MASLTNEERTDLLRALRFRAGQAENTPAEETFPVPEHVRALEPEVALVVGDRGAGKTQLKRALVDERVRAALLRHAPGVRGPTGVAEWMEGWPLGTEGPDGAGWRSATDGAHSEAAKSLWFALLIRSARSHLTDAERESVRPVLDAAGADAPAILTGYRSVETRVTVALDSLDRRLGGEDRWLFVAYDELDVLAPDSWETMGFAVRGLVSFWAAYARRWRRLRPKIFLRSDFYKHHSDVAGADVAKLGANSVELLWSDRSLYGALIKHILNRRDEHQSLSLREHFGKAVKKSREDAVLGMIPILSKAEDAKPFVERLVAQYMGASRSKGFAFRWILDHLRDGNGRALPRSLMWLVEYAALEEVERPRATGAHLLHHTSVRNALDKVSKKHVEQAQSHEFRWLGGLRQRLGVSREVPWSRRELIKLLRHNFEGAWSSEGHRPPGNDAEELLQGLVELGVVRARPNDLYDVPDLYLYGLDLRRRGGVART